LIFEIFWIFEIFGFSYVFSSELCKKHCFYNRKSIFS
jgi:hypothetical protein